MLDKLHEFGYLLILIWKQTYTEACSPTQCFMAVCVKAHTMLQWIDKSRQYHQTHFTVTHGNDFHLTSDFDDSNVTFTLFILGICICIEYA